jgi:hypothetical protein
MAGEANNVTLSTNFNVAPYYDDFDESKNFHRILFRPGLAVQARELTQMQTIMQNQIDRFASHIFQEGSTVRGMEMYYDTAYSFVKLRDNNSVGSSVTVSNFQGRTIKGATSGVIATVINVNDGSEANTPNYKTLFVKYQAANTTTGYRYFANNEIINTVGGALFSANAIPATLGTHVTGAIGTGAAATFQAGVVFAKDHFIRVPEQTVIISKYDVRGSARVGFDVTETIVTETTDDSLLDPASGSYNYAAPGAARLKLEAPIRAYGLTASLANTFVELMQVKGGVVQSVSNRTQYSQIRDYMAGRTYDESGDYVVTGFSIGIRDHLKSGNNSGLFTSAEGGNTFLIAVTADPGKAYVKGYDVDRIVSTNRAADKGIDFQFIDSAKTLADYGHYVIVDNVVGNWDVNQQSVVSLRSAQANPITQGPGFFTTNFPGSEIGTARVRAIKYYAGTPGLPSGQYKLYLTDVTMKAGNSFKNVQSVCYNGGAGTTFGKADILNSTGFSANTVDSSFDRALFKLPSTATRKLRNQSAAVNNNYWFYKSFPVTFTTAGVHVLGTGDSGGDAVTERFDGTAGTLSDDATRSNFYVVARGASNTATLTETLTTNGSNVVTASATIDTKVNPGDIINIHTQGGNFVVSAVSGTTINLFGATSGSAGAGKAFHKRFFPGQVIDFAGAGQSASRTIVTSGSPLTTATLSLNEGTLGNTLPATIVARLNKNDSQEESKTVNRNIYVGVRINAGGGTSYVANTTGPWSLGLSDGFKLVSVRKKTGSNFTTTTEGTDVTSDFILDTGMNDSYYSHARLIKKSTSSLSIGATDRLLVKLDYFTHSSSGKGFFSVDSYPADDVTAGTDTGKIFTYEIPVFTSPTTGERYDLRNCIDNRPRMTDTANATTTLTGLSINPKTSNTFVLPAGGLHFPPSGDSFTTDLTYYQPRVDIVGLTSKGALQIVRGISSNKPVPPTVPEDMMPMAFVNIAPYPSLPEKLGRRINRPDLTNSVRKISNRRYTMKDIGQIAQRIDRLEYYTSLNLLEKSTRDMLVQDSSGLDRFKNGMLIDAFVNHAIGNVFDLDYKITIDPALGHMRPLITNDEIPLVYTSNSTNVVRSNVTPAGIARDQRITLSSTPTSTSFLPGATVTSGAITATIRNKVGTRIYVENATGNFSAANAAITSTDGGSRGISAVKAMTEADNLVTLPYSHKVLVQQPYATTTRNTAGGAWKYKGNIILTPDSDYWCDTTQSPDTNITLDMNTDAWQYLASSWPATYNAPITTFVGTPVVSTTTTNTGQATVQEGNFMNTYQNYEAVTTTTQQTQTTQTGNQTGVAINTTTQSFGNVVKDTSIIPYMRSRMIFVKAVGMKSSSRLYAFFDDINVAAYITPLTSAEYNSNLKDANGNSVTPTATEGTALYSDSSGNVYAVFRLPNDANLRFRTGTKRLRLVDNPTNSSISGQFTTAAEGQYTAEGLSNEVSALTVTTKSVEITQTSLIKTTQGSSTSSTSASGSTLIGSEVIPEQEENQWQESDPAPPPDQDPLAQTFLVTARQTTKVTSSGMYLTKFDLYFATKHPTLPVIVELREVDNLTGNITRRVLPYAKVELAADDINVSDDASAPTPVYFPAPVHLADETEYSIVIGPAATNPNVTVWTAVLGETDITTKNRISSQPATGFLFTSANGRLFSPVQDEDLKFTAYYAQFNTSSVGTLIVKNPLMDTITIANTTGPLSRIGEVVHGETYITGTFAFSGANSTAINTAVSGIGAFAQGVTSGATGKIVSLTSSRIIVRDVSTGAKFTGGEKVRIRIANSSLTTALNGEIKGTSNTYTTTYPTGRVYYYNATDYANTRLAIANTSYSYTGNANSNGKYFLKNTYIKGQSNGYTARIVDYVNITMDNINLVTNMILPSNNDVKAYAKMATTTTTSARDSSFFGININGDTEFNTPRYRLSRAVEANTSLSPMETNRSVEIKYEISGRNSIASPAIDLSRIALSSTHNLISTNAAIGSSEDYVKFGGSSQSRYITRTVTLADGQDAEDLRVYLTAYKPSGSDIFVYYKVLNSDDNDPFADTRWIPMDLDTGQGFTSAVTYSSSEDKNNFLELVYKVPAYTNIARSGANTSTGVLEYRNSARARYVGFKYFAVKIVLVNSTSTNPPRVKDLRAIALQV